MSLVHWRYIKMAFEAINIFNDPANDDSAEGNDYSDFDWSDHERELREDD